MTTKITVATVEAAIASAVELSGGSPFAHVDFGGELLEAYGHELDVMREHFHLAPVLACSYGYSNVLRVIPDASRGVFRENGHNPGAAVSYGRTVLLRSTGLPLDRDFVELLFMLPIELARVPFALGWKRGNIPYFCNTTGMIPRLRDGVRLATGVSGPAVNISVMCDARGTVERLMVAPVGRGRTLMRGLFAAVETVGKHEQNFGIAIPAEQALLMLDGLARGGVIAEDLDRVRRARRAPQIERAQRSFQVSLDKRNGVFRQYTSQSLSEIWLNHGACGLYEVIVAERPTRELYASRAPAANKLIRGALDVIRRCTTETSQPEYGPAVSMLKAMHETAMEYLHRIAPEHASRFTA